ncbi:MAG: hypothetical protein DME18_04910 [Verrucomicrobia bacterium]|nr:MAG: hypothetical protein DME18_04910 [Verrucomicrobiota bacterium]
MAEVFAWLEFDSPGYYRLGVHSDEAMRSKWARRAGPMEPLLLRLMSARIVGHPVNGVNAALRLGLRCNDSV